MAAHLAGIVLDWSWVVFHFLGRARAPAAITTSIVCTRRSLTLSRIRRLCVWDSKRYATRARFTAQHETLEQR